MQKDTNGCHPPSFMLEIRKDANCTFIMMPPADAVLLSTLVFKRLKILQGIEVLIDEELIFQSICA